MLALQLESRLAMVKGNLFPIIRDMAHEEGLRDLANVVGGMPSKLRMGFGCA